MLTRRSFAHLGLGAGVMALLGGLFGCGGGASTKASRIEASRIRTVRYSWGGGMEGGSEASELSRQKDGSVTLVTSEREWHNARERSITYTLDESAFETFAQIANDYDLVRASKRKMSDLIVYDAPTGTISYTLMDEEGLYDIDRSFSIHSDQELTDHEREGWRAVTKALAELAASHEGVENIEPRMITFAVNGVQYQFVSNGSVAAEDLCSRMPLDIVVENDGVGALACQLGEPLEVGDTPAATGAAGTMCYDANNDALLICYADFQPAEGLYQLASVQYGWDVDYLAEVEASEYTMYCNE